MRSKFGLGYLPIWKTAPKVIRCTPLSEVVHRTAASRWCTSFCHRVIYRRAVAGCARRTGLLFLIVIILLNVASFLYNVIYHVDDTIREVVNIDHKTLLNNMSTISWPAECTDNVRFLIGVCISPHKFRRRQIIRQTYGQLLDLRRYGARLVFIIGHSDNVNVDDEMNSHGDIVLAQFQDSYLNLSIKSLVLLKYSLERCPNVQYVIKADDDVYINVEHMTRQLSSAPSEEITGMIIPSLRMIFAFQRNYVPSFVDSRWFGETIAFGPCYEIPMSQLSKIYDTALSISLHPNEDHFITGIVRSRCGFGLRQDKFIQRFPWYNLFISRCGWKSATAVFNVDENMMLEAHSVLSDANLNC